VKKKANTTTANAQWQSNITDGQRHSQETVKTAKNL